MLENPHQAALLGVEAPSGLLLYGPPGTGKTTIARVLASEAKCRFFTTSPAEVHSMWIGEGEKSVARLFDEARAAAPSILFLDEIDALIPSRAGGVHQPSDKIVNQFLHEMDGLVQNTGLFFIGATNRPDMVDPALLRGGRLSRKIEIPLPAEDARLAILRLNVQGAVLSESVDIESLAHATDGFAGADLRAAGQRGGDAGAHPDRRRRRGGSGDARRFRARPRKPRRIRNISAKLIPRWQSPPAGYPP